VKREKLETPKPTDERINLRRTNRAHKKTESQSLNTNIPRRTTNTEQHSPNKALWIDNKPSEQSEQVE
jgi:hypothetical protein